MARNSTTCYLIIGIMPPEITHHSKPIEDALYNVDKRLGINIWSIYLLPENISSQGYEEKWDHLRYVFTFTDGVANQQSAQRIVELLYLSLVLTTGSTLQEVDITTYYAFPGRILDRDKYLPIDVLLDYNESLPCAERIEKYSLILALRQSISVGKILMNQMWSLVPVLLIERLATAASFLEASYREFYVHHVDMDQIFAYPNKTTSSMITQTRLENALWNAFKTIETLIGSIPKNDTKYFAKLRSIGADPFEKVGYNKATPLHVKLRQFDHLRDTKAAHGSTAERRFALCELLECQLCARYLLTNILERKLGRPVDIV